MKKTVTKTTVEWQCDSCGLTKSSMVRPDGWVERKQKTFCSLDHAKNQDNSPEVAIKRKEFQANLAKFIKESNKVIKQRDECLEKSRKLSAELEKLSETYGIPLEDSDGYFSSIDQWRGDANYIPNSFLTKEYWKLFRDGNSGYDMTGPPLPDQVFHELLGFESEDDVSVGWNSSSC